MSATSPGNAYRVFSLLLLPFWLIHAFLHGRKYGQTDYLLQRLIGLRRSSKKAYIWVHASSVGEVAAITPLVKKFLEEDEKILFTSFTATGLQTIRKNFPGAVDSTVIPVDFLPCCWRLFLRHPIKLCLLMETELWPELLYQAARKKVPIIQVNARLSKKSTEAPIFIRYLLRRALENIHRHLARNEQDKQSLIELGAPADKIKIIGNLKTGVENQQSHENLINRDYLLLASTHEDEEALFLDHRKAINTLIVIAPRHPKRSEAIQRYLFAKRINFAVRSKNEPISGETEVYLADTLGELKSLMAHARLVIMGGSFDQTGGHNLIEPASLGCAIITGPSDSNITNDIRMLGDGIIQVADIEACWDKILFLLDNSDEAKALGNRVQQTIRQQNNILEHYMEEIRPYYQR